MFLAWLMYLCAAILLTKASQEDLLRCVSFNSVSTLTPASGGYNASLTFTVLNTCQAARSQVSSVKVYLGAVHQFSQPTCYVRYRDSGRCVMGMGCDCDGLSNWVSVERHLDTAREQVWILEGKLENDWTFNETVFFSTEENDSPEQKPLTVVIVIAASASAALVVVILLVVCLCCLRRKAFASKPASRQSARGCPGRPLPQQPPSACAQDTVQAAQSRCHARPHSSHIYVDADHECVKAAAASAAKKAHTEAKSHTTGDNYLHPVCCAGEKGWKSHDTVTVDTQALSTARYDDDGYLLADPVVTQGTGKGTAM